MSLYWPVLELTKEIKEGSVMALIIRLVQQKFCYHQWITVWIGRGAVYDVCLLCRKRIIDRETEYERIPSRMIGCGPSER